MLEFIREAAAKTGQQLRKRKVLDTTVNVLTYAGLAGTALSIIANQNKAPAGKGKQLIQTLNGVKQLSTAIRG